MTTLHALATFALLCWMSGQSAPMKFTTLARGDQSQIEERRDVVVRTMAEWTALWKQHGGQGPPPAVDLTGSMVIGVFEGSRPTAGYAVEITRIEKDDRGLVVTYREEVPAPGDMLAQVMTSPFHIVRTATYNGGVRFQRTP